MAASSSKTDNPPPPPLGFYSLILDAIHTLYRLQTDLSFPLTRDQATEILTKILYRNQIPILEAVQLFQAFEDTGKITLEDTFFFMMRQFFRSDSAVATRVVQEQQDLIYQQEKKLSRFPKEEESLPVYNLVCNVCQKESQYVSASEFGRHVLQHIRGGDSHSAAMAENGGDGAGKSYRCKTCGKTFDKFQALGGHQHAHRPLNIDSNASSDGREN